MTRLADLVRVGDPSGVAAARRVATQQAETVGLSATAVGKVALVATELATNLAKHGDGGSILVGSGSSSHPSVTIVALDRGRGIANVAAAFQDGYSTAGSPGTGLGAIARASTFLDVYTLAERGTAVLCRIEEPRPALPGVAARARADVGGVCLPKSGELEAGDSWAFVSAGGITTILVADGLGHGPAAATAAVAAVRSFLEKPEAPLEHVLADAHGALRPTRGAAVGIARIHHDIGRLDFAGVGNIAGSIISEDAVRRVVSVGGIVGHEMRKVQTFSYPWTPASVLVMHSDGVSANWAPATYAGLTQRDAALIAAVLYRDHCRGTDDATVVVAKH